MMEESRYNQMVSQVFQRILVAADEEDPDVLESSTSGDMVTLTAGNGEKCIVSTQRAVRQIWVAGKGLGIHFSYDEEKGLWMDDKGKGLELFSFVADVVKTISGVDLRYPPA